MNICMCTTSQSLKSNREDKSKVLNLIYSTDIEISHACNVNNHSDHVYAGRFHWSALDDTQIFAEVAWTGRVELPNNATLVGNG